MAGAVLKAGRKLEWFTLAMQDRLIQCCRDGMKPEWAAKRCRVAPRALLSILEIGARKGPDAEVFREFVGRWIEAEAELVEEKVAAWKAGDGGAYVFLKERWPNDFGPKAKPAFDPFAIQDETGDDLAQLEAILANPFEFGLEELFAKHGRLRPDGT